MRQCSILKELLQYAIINGPTNIYDILYDKSKANTIHPTILAIECRMSDYLIIFYRTA